jgi:hypothetical protein
VLRDLGKKSETPPEIFHNTYNQTIGDHPKHIKIFTDGSKKDEKVAAAYQTTPPLLWLSCVQYSWQLKSSKPLKGKTS